MSKVRHLAGGQFTVGGEYVGTDWDYPRAAERVGWSMRRVQKVGKEVKVLSRAPDLNSKTAKKLGYCAHRSTDGTVKCEDCGLPASAFIQAASAYLHDRTED